MRGPPRLAASSFSPASNSLPASSSFSASAAGLFPVDASDERVVLLEGRRRSVAHRPGDDQGRTGLVDEDRVHLVDDGVPVTALDPLLQGVDHVVPEIVEAELVVGPVCDVRGVRRGALGRVRLVLVDAVHRDAVGRPLQCQGLRQPRQGGLGCGVGEHLRAALARREPADVNDLPLSPLQEVRSNCPAAQECLGQINVHHEAPLVIRQRLAARRSRQWHQRLADGVAQVVDQHVDMPPALHGDIERALPVLRLGGVRRQSVDGVSGIRHLPRQWPEVAVRKRRDHDLGARLGQDSGDALADASGGTGDDDGPALDAVLGG